MNPSNRRGKNCMFLHVPQVLVPSGTSLTGRDRDHGKALLADASRKGTFFPVGWVSYGSLGGKTSKATPQSSYCCCCCTFLHHKALLVQGFFFSIFCAFSLFLSPSQ